jgi:hypothetical protein
VSGEAEFKGSKKSATHEKTSPGAVVEDQRMDENG